ncbi:sodium:proton antiporter [Parvularcula lutaonensis]|uniref:Sodium:proton antiporter n=1 Tax=Parvularcula lutaonensis TaxID=491923 RepID=A0ABV7ME67_9PROT|nr:cation:proton antiporter subunit C [Parvularcula lutaonensis]GGY54776.1 sodium:proton antiporter [Parvularcula lutaonensis]
MLEFILARYNYWIVICLMMTGLYIVFARGNLVKTLIGLNLFQTSVFIFYITVGKVIGGTAPILIENKKKDGTHGGDHGAGHGESHSEAPVGFVSSDEAEHLVSEGAAHEATDPSVTNQIGYGQPGAGGQATESLHLQPPATPANELFKDVAGDAAHAAGASSDAAAAATDILYSNPLPHVLILTAIVVGVATTAVGLSLAVRIREAYGTVEEDDLESMDNAAEVAEVAR